ncbi:Lipase 5 [Pleosporales sp. CAS-2024a]
MSILTDTIVAGASTRLHAPAGPHAPASPSKSKSHGGLLAPLVHLARSPMAALNHAVAVSSSRLAPPETPALATEAESRTRILYLRMHNAENYGEWKAAATELDALQGNDPWKEEHDSSEYDVDLIAARLKELDDTRLSCDVKQMHFLLRTALARNLGGMGGLQLYRHSHVGTKKLIERYIESAQKTLAAFLDVSAKQGHECPLTCHQLLDQMKLIRASFGRSALLLSGGGTFGMNHIGVVKCLWDQRLLPRIISGASAGSIVCAVLATKTDEEIPAVMHDFCYGELDVFEKAGEPESYVTKVLRMFKTGGLFNIEHLKRVMQNILGNMTFREAHRRTGRVLNIPVSSSSHFELPRLLNFVTAPNVIIWSAVCTSCSVPLVYAESQLLSKNPKTNEEEPWDPNPNATWIDGSVDNDLPMTRLAEMFNVNHFIVSQVNPHVVPFLEKDEELITTEQAQVPIRPSDPGWLLNSLNIARGEAVHRMQMIGEAGILQSTVTKLGSILSQRYSGDINIFPQVSLADLPMVLSNPTPEYMVGCMLAGQRATWPKLSRIQNHLSIELALDDAVKVLYQRVVCEDRLDDARNNMSRPTSAGNDASRLHRSKSSYKMARFEFKTQPPSPALRKSAPNSPYLSRASLKKPPSPPCKAPCIEPTANSSRKRVEVQQGVQHSTTPPALQVLSPSTNEEGSSDRDYFAEVDSDTTDVLSSSPAASPAPQPSLWPAANDYLSFHSLSQPSTPYTRTTAPSPATPAAPSATPFDRRSGILLNLSMTPATANLDSATAAPSSPELRYKRLFHPPPASVPLDTRPMETGGSKTPASTPGSRRGSDIGLVRNPSFDNSGTRGMLMRKKSLGKMTPDSLYD